MVCVAQYSVASVRMRSREMRRLHLGGVAGRGVAPLDELLGDPREQSGGGVVQPGGEGVRSGALHVRVARLVVPAGRHAVVEGALGGVARRLPLGLRQEVRVRDDDPGDRLGVRRGDQVADVRGEVLAVGEVAGVAEDVGHERVHQRGEALLGGRLVERRGEREAGHAHDDHVEVRQQVGEVQLEREGVRPAVHHQERRGVRGRRPQVGEVQRGAVDVGEELRVLVQPGLAGAPVERLPRRDELPQVRRGHARCGPPGGVVEEARARQAVTQVVEDRLRDVDGERSDGHAHTLGGPSDTRPRSDEIDPDGDQGPPQRPGAEARLVP